MVNKNLATFRVYRFPKRTYSHDDFSTYLFRIKDEPYSTSSYQSPREGVGFDHGPNSTRMACSTFPRLLACQRATADVTPNFPG